MKYLRWQAIARVNCGPGLRGNEWKNSAPVSAAQE
jgi:hypothetical protein